MLSVPTSTNTSVTQESTRSLLAVNAATIIVAIALHWPVPTLVPMHASILLGTALGNNSALAMLLFGALKTGADVLMHHIEHRVLQRSESVAPA